MSTEQILHPELYPDEVPVPVELPDLAALLGPGWSTSYAQTMGEMQLGVWLGEGRPGEVLLPDLRAALTEAKAEAAAGWGGDRLVSLDGPDGAWAVAWQTAWDSARDASDFEKAANSAMKDLDGASDVLDADIVGGLSSPRLVLLADSGKTMDVLQVALDLGS